jgi:Ca2+-binding EF-hand superfamily protein
VNTDQLKKASSEAAEIAVKKIAGGAEDFNNMREYVKHLFSRFDANRDGAISLDELSKGVASLGIQLTAAERQSLMKKFDTNYDGEVSQEELFNVLSATNAKLSKTQLGNSVDQVLRKMASGADKFGSMKEYIQTLVTRFDQNRDGHISFDELCVGLNSF